MFTFFCKTRRYLDEDRITHLTSDRTIQSTKLSKRLYHMAFLIQKNTAMQGLKPSSGNRTIFPICQNVRDQCGTGEDGTSK